ncbi:MAG: ZIP family metal transporter [Myxococcota bacterium]
MLHALIAATLAGLATGLGALPFTFAAGVPRRAYDALLGVGAGLMLSAATLGLLAHALEKVRTDGSTDGARLALVVLGFLAGAGLMWAMDRFVPHVHAGGHPEHEPGEAQAAHQGMLLTGGVVLHRIPEGLAIGSAFVHGGALGTMLTVAIAVQNVCEGVVLSAPLRRGGFARLRNLIVVTSTGLALPLAAVVGFLASAQLPSALPFLLALAAGALIHLVSNEVIPESHSHGNEGLATLGLVVGFLTTVLLQVATGPHS